MKKEGQSVADWTMRYSTNTNNVEKINTDQTNTSVDQSRSRRFVSQYSKTNKLMYSRFDKITKFKWEKSDEKIIWSLIL